jgi:hypothetical protein
MSESVEKRSMVKLPPPWLTLLCLALFGFGELAGAVLGGLPQPIMAAAQAEALTHPDVHGLSGVADIDRTILEGIGSEVLARVHTFHLHSHGLALVVFLLSFIVVNAGFTDRVKRVLTAALCSGLAYPFGWLTMALAVPVLGKSGAFRLAERWFFIPFGGGFLAAVWALIAAYAVYQWRARRA